MASCDKVQSVHGLNVPVPDALLKPMFVREKRLLGAGPSNPPTNVRNALSLPMMGHLHPETLKVSVKHFSISQKMLNSYFLKSNKNFDVPN